MRDRYGTIAEGNGSISYLLSGLRAVLMSSALVGAVVSHTAVLVLPLFLFDCEDSRGTSGLLWT